MSAGMTAALFGLLHLGVPKPREHNKWFEGDRYSRSAARRRRVRRRMARASRQRNRR